MNAPAIQLAAASASARFEAAPYEYAQAQTLMRELDLAEPVAITLARRGYGDPETARAFISGQIEHPPDAFEGIEEAAETVAAAIEAGSLITIHGDYDVDGMSATATLVEAVRSYGGQCDWLIPDRVSEGYGLSVATVERLAERGTELLITVDCGIACPDEVEHALGLGMEVIVTDHHQPAERLPECMIVHPQISGYPFEGLCGAAVAHKLAEAVGSVLGTPMRPAHDLVALATVADLVPLVDENRTLVRKGLEELRRGRRPGLAALCEVAKAELEHLDEGDIAFRLAPRLNAAGRLYKADAGVELMLAADHERAAQIAGELDATNHERREVEREVYAGARTALRELPPELASAPGLVLAGKGWHPGVVGIAASRIVEAEAKPAVLLGIDENGRAKGSGRSIPGFDLLAALRECAEHLDRFGGHRAAAGVELAAENVEAFRAAFAAACERAMPDGPPPVPERIDAVVGAEALDIQVAEQIKSLGPFGQGNPEVRLLVPWAKIGEIKPMGEGGRHARFNLSSGAASASGVVFNGAAALDGLASAPADLTVRLELNHWNGAVEPRAVLAKSGGVEGSGRVGCACSSELDEAWWSAFDAERSRDLGELAIAAPGTDSRPAGRTEVVHGARSTVALIAEMLSSGDRIAVVCADARMRDRLASLAASPGRFGREHLTLCSSCPPMDVGEECSLLMTEWELVASRPELLAGFPHVICVDPPASPGQEAAALQGSGWLHRCWGGSGDLPERALAERWQPRARLAEIFRAIGDDPRTGAEADAILAGDGERPARPTHTGRCIRVLEELGLVGWERSGGGGLLRVLSSEKTELDRSEAWRAYTQRHEDGLRFLRSRKAS